VEVFDALLQESYEQGSNKAMQMVDGLDDQVDLSQVAQELRREHRGVQALAEKLRNDDIDATALLVRGPTVETV
jgi:hypothetical protein